MRCRVRAEAPSRAYVVTCIAGGAIIAWLLLRPLWTMHGVPAFNHDWSWPPDRIQAWSQFRDSIAPFTRNNFGQFNFYIGSAPSVLAAVLAIQVFGASVGIKVLASLLVLGAVLAAFGLARRLGAEPVVAGSCALVYGASPVVANELAAGHLAYLFGYAALPIIALSGMRLASGSQWKVAALALLLVVPFSIAQPQFIVFDALVILLFVPWARNRRSTLVLVIAALAILCSAPYEIGLSLFGHPLSALSSDRTNLHWEMANSSTLWGAYIGSGYVRPYDATDSAALLASRAAAGVLLWSIAIVNVIRSRRWVPFFVLSLLASWLSAGLNGPLWRAMKFAFIFVPQLAVFRELYHFSGLVMLGLLTLCALSRSRPMTWILPFAAVLFALPQLTGEFWRFVGTYDPAEITTIARIVNVDRRTDSILFWPLLQPLGPSAALAGSDPDAYPIGSHASLAEFVPIQPLSQLGVLLCDPKRDPQRTLARFGVRYVVVRPAWRSLYDERLEAELRDLVVGRDPQNCAGDRVLRGLHVVWRGASHTLATVEAPKPLVGGTLSDPVWRLPIERALEANVRTPDPRRGWVDGNRWQWWDPSFAGPVNPGLFSLGRIPYELPPRSGDMRLIVNAPGGLIFSGDSLRTVLGGARGFRAVSIPKNASVVTSPAAAMLAGLARTYRGQPEHRSACSSVVNDRIVASHCPQVGVEILALPGAPWHVSDRNARPIVPLPSSWDLKWSASKEAAPLSVVEAFDTPIALALLAQYVSWSMSLAALPAIFWIYLRDRRRLGEHSSTSHGASPILSDRNSHV